jgi:hypothetical protein
MSKEPMVSKADAEALAIYYSAFCERPLDDDSAMIVWGGGLLRMQEKTGIELQKTRELHRIVERAFRNKAAKRPTVTPDSSWQPADDLIDATECMNTDEYIAHLGNEA